MFLVDILLLPESSSYVFSQAIQHLSWETAFSLHILISQTHFRGTIEECRLSHRGDRNTTNPVAVFLPAGRAPQDCGESGQRGTTGPRH